jgi:hypothetical protein
MSPSHAPKRSSPEALDHLRLLLPVLVAVVATAVLIVSL